MGAKIEIDNNVAIVHGPTDLHGGPGSRRTNLRGGSALILAGLAAEGETVISNGYLIDRGHAAIAERLRLSPRSAPTSQSKPSRRRRGSSPFSPFPERTPPARGRLSFAAGRWPIETRAPSPANGRTEIPAASHAWAKAVVSSPSRSQTKLASLSGTAQPSASSAAPGRGPAPSRRPPPARTAWFWRRNEATAAAWATEFTVKGSIVFRTASATGSWPMTKPTRRPAKPVGLGEGAQHGHVGAVAVECRYRRTPGLWMYSAVGLVEERPGSHRGPGRGTRSSSLPSTTVPVGLFGLQTRIEPACAS